MSKLPSLRQKLPKIVGMLLNAYAVLFPKKAAKKALDIFSKPRKGRPKPFHRPFLDKFEAFDLPSGSAYVRAYFMNKNADDTILLVHGWESNTFRWRKLVAFLEAVPVNIVCLDAPAHGESGGKVFTGILYAGYIKTVVEKFQPKVIIGHSIGGFASSYYLYHNRETPVSDLILLATPDTMEEIIGQYFDIIGAGPRLVRAFYDQFEGWFSHPVTYYSTSNFTQTIRQNGMIVHDEFDNINMYHNALAIHEHWPKSVLHTTSGLGHSLQSKKVYGLVASYLESRFSATSE